MTAIATLAYTTSRENDAAIAVARIAAAGRVTRARIARENREARERAHRAELMESGQHSDEYGDWCFICSRATDHFGEHTEEQIERWRAAEKHAMRWTTA